VFSINKQKFDEFMRLDLNIKDLEDNNKNKRNERWKLKNERLRLAQEIAKTILAITDLKKQQYGILGRTFIELEETKTSIDIEEKKKNN